MKKIRSVDERWNLRSANSASTTTPSHSPSSGDVWVWACNVWLPQGPNHSMNAVVRIGKQRVTNLAIVTKFSSAAFAGVPGSIPGWGVCDFFSFCQSFTSNFPFPLSFPLSFPSSSFPFLFLSLRPFVCALKFSPLREPCDTGKTTTCGSFFRAKSVNGELDGSGRP